MFITKIVEACVSHVVSVLEIQIETGLKLFVSWDRRRGHNAREISDTR